MLRLLAAVAVATAPEPSQAPPVAPAKDLSAEAELIGSPDIVRAADYPSEALRRGLEGRVWFELQIDERGQVNGCEVQQSSGHDTIDRATCALYQSRARYSPARDTTGTPKEANDQRSVDWRIDASGPQAIDYDSPDMTGGVRIFRADDYPMEALQKLEQGSVTALLRVDAAGTLQACTIEQSSGSYALDTRTCEVIGNRGQFEPARDEDGTPGAGLLRQKVTWRLEESRGLPWEEWTHRLTIRFSAPGKVSACTRDLSVAAASTPVDCQEEAAAMAGVHARFGFPERTSDAIMEMRFVPRKLSSAELEIPAGVQVYSRRVLEIVAGSDTADLDCTLVQGIGAGPPVSVLCAEAQRDLAPPKAMNERGAAATGTYILSIQTRAER